MNTRAVNPTEALERPSRRDDAALAVDAGADVGGSRAIRCDPHADSHAIRSRERRGSGIIPIEAAIARRTAMDGGPLCESTWNQ